MKLSKIHEIKLPIVPDGTNNAASVPKNAAHFVSSSKISHFRVYHSLYANLKSYHLQSDPL